jgi:hypothetical protein
MSPSDVTMPLISAPWLNADGNPLSVTPLPGLRSEVVRSLECSYPGLLSPLMKDLLGRSCGLAGTALGSIDFTGCWFQEEPYLAFRPALTLAIDEAERRWVAEVGNNELPGPVWCVFPRPEVAVYVSDDLAAFLNLLRKRTCRGETEAWLRELSAQARAVWSRRHALALRPHEVHRVDRPIRGWLATLPQDAYVYDLRMPAGERGWPYGVSGPSGRHYRCGRELVFAVAGPPAEGWRVTHPQSRVPRMPQAVPSVEVSFAISSTGGRRNPRTEPKRPGPVILHRQRMSRRREPPERGLEATASGRRSCA